MAAYQQVTQNLPSTKIKDVDQAVIRTLGRKKSTKQKRALILSLLSNQSLTQNDIAEIAGTSPRTVARAAESLRNAGGNSALIERECDAYRRLIRKRLPDTKAVDAIETSMLDVRFALGAVKYRDQVLGVGPAIEAEAPGTKQPVFLFGPGSAVRVEVQVTKSEPQPVDLITTTTKD